MSLTNFEKSLLNEKFISKLNALKHSLRSSDDAETNGVNNSNDDNAELEKILSNNQVLLNYLTKVSLDHKTTAYKNIILEKIKDVDYLKVQSFVGNANKISGLIESGNNSNEQLGFFNKSDANLYVFKSQTKSLFLENQHFIKHSYLAHDENQVISNGGTINMLVTICSLEAPNVKMMSKNLFNNLLQQIVFSNDKTLYRSDLYKIYAPDDSVKCHKFMSDYQIDLDLGLGGLFYIGNLLKTMLNISSFHKLRIICFYKDFKKFIPMVIEEFFVRLNDMLLDIHNSETVKEVLEFVNVFDNESDDVSLSEDDFSLMFSENTKRQIFLNYKKFNLLYSPKLGASNNSSESKGDFIVSNRIFIKFMEALDWNIVFDVDIIQLIANQLENEIDKGHWISYLEDFFTEVLVNYFYKSTTSSNKFVSYSILGINCKDIRLDSSKSIFKKVVEDSSFQKFIERLAMTDDINVIKKCKLVLENEAQLLKAIETDFSKRMPRVNSFFKALVSGASADEIVINDFNFFKLYANAIQFLTLKNKNEIESFLKLVHKLDNNELVESFVYKSLETDLTVSDVFLSYKTIEDINILQQFNPKYRANIMSENIKEIKDKPYLHVAYSAFLEIYNHLDRPVKLGDLYYCFKESIKEKVPFEDDNTLMALFIYTINHMIHSGLYEIENLHAVKSAFKGF